MVWRLWLLFLAIAAASAVYGSAASLQVDGGTLQVFVYTVTIPSATPSPTGTATATATPAPALLATVDVKPESLQKRSQGQPVTAFVELPAGHDVSQIDVDSVRLCLGSDPCGSDGVPPDGAPGAKPKVGDYDGDGVPDLKVTFDRAAVIALVEGVKPPATVTFTVSGDVGARTFAGGAAVKLVDPDPKGTATPSATPSATPTVALTPDASPTGSPTASPTPAPSETPTPAADATPTATPTATPEDAGSPTPTATATVEASPTPTPEAQTTATTTPSPTPVPTSTPAASPPSTPTGTPTATAAPSPTPTSAPTATWTATATPTATAQPTATATPTAGMKGGS